MLDSFFLFFLLCLSLMQDDGDREYIRAPERSTFCGRASYGGIISRRPPPI